MGVTISYIKWPTNTRMSFKVAFTQPTDSIEFSFWREFKDSQKYQVTMNANNTVFFQKFNDDTGEPEPADSGPIQITSTYQWTLSGESVECVIEFYEKTISVKTEDGQLIWEITDVDQVEYIIAFSDVDPASKPLEFYDQAEIENRSPELSGLDIGLIVTTCILFVIVVILICIMVRLRPKLKSAGIGYF